MSDITPSAPPTLEYLRAHRDEILTLAAQYGASNVRVFGSVARGDATPTSDIDLLADFNDHSLLDRIRLMQALSDLLGVPVEVMQERSLRSHVKPQATQEAVPL